MPRLIDTRNFHSAPIPDGIIYRSDASEEVSGLTGNPRRLPIPQNLVGLLQRRADDLPTESEYIETATQVVHQLRGALGYTGEEDAPSFASEASLSRGRGGGAMVHLYQELHGIPVFGMSRAVAFAANRALIDIVGDSLPISHELSRTPERSAREAASFGALHLALDAAPQRQTSWTEVPELPRPELAEYSPSIMSADETPTQRSVLSAGPFASDVTASLTYFVRSYKVAPLLSWALTFDLQHGDGEYLVIVSACGPSEILYCQRIDSGYQPVRGSVYRASPGVESRVLVDFPLARAELPSLPWRPLAEAFPNPWVDGRYTEGNNATVLCRGPQGFTLCESRQDGERLTFDHVSGSVEEQATNAFYFVNYLHDFFHCLGFDEAAGNFQRQKSGGTGGDAVRVEIEDGAFRGVATMSTPREGVAPLMRLGPFLGAEKRHSSLDADVVFHEFTHGVSNRLVGGPKVARTLMDPQSRGLGEGWSDFIALSIQNCGRARANQPEKVISGDWLTGRASGIRGLPYDEHFGDGFGNIGGGRYTAEHNLGELWCGFLMQLLRAFSAALPHSNSDEASAARKRIERIYGLTWQLVVDGMKLCPANPSFLDARTGLVRALDDLQTGNIVSAVEYPLLRRALWQTLARFGMGEKARSNGAQLSGVVGDSTLPADLK